MIELTDELKEMAALIPLLEDRENYFILMKDDRIRALKIANDSLLFLVMDSISDIEGLHEDVTFLNIETKMRLPHRSPRVDDLSLRVKIRKQILESLRLNLTTPEMKLTELGKSFVNQVRLNKKTYYNINNKMELFKDPENEENKDYVKCFS